ncbi:MAG: hypothetical protein ACI87O_002464 [Planctomycetota bacterium]
MCSPNTPYQFTMTSALFSCRWMAIILLSFGLANTSCKGPAQDQAVEVAIAPSHYYLISYANSFVGALRAGGTAAGAFEISRHTEADGLYHLKIELMEDEGLKTLDLSYEGRDAELRRVSDRFGDDEEVPEFSKLGRKLSACHKVADLGARVELGSEHALPSTEWLVDVSASGVPGRVAHRYIRLRDLAIRESFSELEISEGVDSSFDLHFARDRSYEFMGLYSTWGRNLMRLGTGSEQHVQRLAQIMDWQDSPNFPALVEAVGIKIDKDSNAGYWSPLFNVPLRAGTVFAVRSPRDSAPTDASAPAGLIYVQESQGDIVRLLIVRPPHAKGLETDLK